MGDEEATPADEVQPDTATADQQDSGGQASTAPDSDSGGIQPDSLYHE